MWYFFWTLFVLYIDILITTTFLLQYLPINYESISDNTYYNLHINLFTILQLGLPLPLSIFYYKKIDNYYRYDKFLGFLFFVISFFILNYLFKFYLFKIQDINNFASLPIKNNILSLAMAFISTILFYFYIKYKSKK